MFVSCTVLFIVVNLRYACIFSEEEQLAPIDLKLQEPPKLKWEDEDVDEDEVKDSWEDDDEPAPVRTIENDFQYCILFTCVHLFTFIMLKYKKRMDIAHSELVNTILLCN
jgi:hypothetical protein